MALSRHHRRSLGFTMIELLVIMVILGILSTIGIGSFISSQQKGRDARRKSDLGQITTALETYYNDKGSYPLSSASHGILGCNGEQECDWGGIFQDENQTVYMVTLPSDPRDWEYHYFSSDGRSFQIYARLENNLDPDVPKNGSNAPQVFSGVGCGGLDCNYGVASSNTTASVGRILLAD